VLVDPVEREERVAEVVEDAHEEDDVEALPERRDVVDAHPDELDLGAGDLGREARLRQVAVVGVDADDARRAAPLHLDRVEAGVAPDVEHGLAPEIGRDRALEAAPFQRGVVPQEMVRRRLHAVQIEVMEPLPERRHARRDLVPGERAPRRLRAPAQGALHAAGAAGAATARRASSSARSGAIGSGWRISKSRPRAAGPRRRSVHAIFARVCSTPK
jgi:hypothetical protein